MCLYICKLILCQFKFWKYYFQASMRVKIATFYWGGTDPQTHQMSLQQITLVHLHLALIGLFWINNIFMIIDQCRFFNFFKCSKIALYSLFGQPVFSLISALSKNKGIQSGALLKMLFSFSSREEFCLDIQEQISLKQAKI